MLVKWSIELFGYYEWDNKIQITWTLKYIIALALKSNPIIISGASIINMEKHMSKHP